MRFQETPIKEKDRVQRDDVCGSGRRLAELLVTLEANIAEIPQLELFRVKPKEMRQCDS